MLKLIHGEDGFLKCMDKVRKFMPCFLHPSCTYLNGNTKHKFHSSMSLFPEGVECWLQNEQEILQATPPVGLAGESEGAACSGGCLPSPSLLPLHLPPAGRQGLPPVPQTQRREPDHPLPRGRLQGPVPEGSLQDQQQQHQHRKRREGNQMALLSSPV